MSEVTAKSTRVFEVQYAVTHPVDQHPTGPRIRVVLARNWMDASDRVRKAYGDEHQGSIRVNRVTHREDARKVVDFDRWGRAA